jgi:hypothetical protein
MTTGNVTTTRRAILAGAASLPALAIPAAALSAPDPIFEAIEWHRHRLAEMNRLDRLIDEAEDAARDVYGHRPIPLVHFNNHTIDDGELEHHRMALLAVTGADRKKIEREYHRAKKRLAELERGGPEWDELAGIADLRSECAKATELEREALLALLTGKPATAAGIAALLRYLHAWSDDLDAGWLNDWLDPISSAGAGFMLVVADAIEGVAGKGVQS